MLHTSSTTLATQTARCHQLHPALNLLIMQPLLHRASLQVARPASGAVGLLKARCLKLAWHCTVQHTLSFACDRCSHKHLYSLPAQTHAHGRMSQHAPSWW